MIIIIDTREQIPFKFKGQICTTDTLPFGDYSLKGFTDKCCVERKGPDDFLTSITSDQVRFKQRLIEMAEIEFKVIVVECELSAILKMCDPKTKVKPRRSKFRPGSNSSKRKIHPNVIKGFLKSAYVKYGVPVYFAIDRKDAESFTLGVLKKYYDLKRGEL